MKKIEIELYRFEELEKNIQNKILQVYYDKKYLHYKNIYIIRIF